MATPPIAVNANATSALAPDPNTNMVHGERYSFFLNDGTKVDGPKLYERLIASAQSKIVIWDPFVNTDDMNLLFNISQDTALIIITSCSSQRWEDRRNNLHNSLKAHISEEKKASVTVSLGYIDTDIHGSHKWNCHDRFLIIDDSEYYLIGSSMAHHRSLLSSTGIMHVEHESDKTVIQEAFNKVYNEVMSKGWISTYPNLL